jgi:hypothetical protein
MEFKILIRHDAYVSLGAYDLDRGEFQGERVLWRPEYRQFAADESALDAARLFADNLAEFTGFELVNLEGRTAL